MGKSNFIWIGPNVPPLGIKKFTLFRGEQIPSRLKPYLDQKPVLSALYVPTKNLAEAQRQLAVKGTLEHTANKEMEAIAKAIPH